MAMSVGMKIEENIKRLIEDKNWTIYKLSKESGVSLTPLYALGKREQGPHADTLIKLSNTLGVTVDELVR